MNSQCPPTACSRTVKRAQTQICRKIAKTSWRLPCVPTFTAWTVKEKAIVSFLSVRFSSSFNEGEIWLSESLYCKNSQIFVNMSLNVVHMCPHYLFSSLWNYFSGFCLHMYNSFLLSGSAPQGSFLAQSRHYQTQIQDQSFTLLIITLLCWQNLQVLKRKWTVHLESRGKIRVWFLHCWECCVRYIFCIDFSGLCTTSAALVATSVVTVWAWVLNWASVYPSLNLA